MIIEQMKLKKLNKNLFMLKLKAKFRKGFLPNVVYL